jgi:hypothetical protein
MDQAREVLPLKRYSIRTERCYCDWIKRYIKFHGMQSRGELEHRSTKVLAGIVYHNLVQEQGPPFRILCLLRLFAAIQLPPSSSSEPRQVKNLPQKPPPSLPQKTPSSVTHPKIFPHLFSHLLHQEHVLLPYYILGGSVAAEAGSPAAPNQNLKSKTQNPNPQSPSTIHPSTCDPPFPIFYLLSVCPLLAR